MKKRIYKKDIFNLIDKDVVSSSSAQEIKDYIEHLLKSRNNNYWALPRTYEKVGE